MGGGTNFKQLIKRAQRGLRDDLKLYLVAVSSLTVAFLCLSSALLAVSNLSEIADRWGKDRRMTVYLSAEPEEEDVQQLLVLLSSLPEVSEVRHLSSADARAEFLEHIEGASELEGIDAEAFPASVEVSLKSTVGQGRAAELKDRLSQFSAVDEVEDYGSWYGQLESLLTTGRSLAIALSILVVICVLAVVGNTIRLAVAGRGQEIEVMKLCGATDRFVRGPFVIEGTFQGFLAASLAVVLLGAAYLIVRDQLDASLLSLAGGKIVFLHPVALLSVVLGGAMAGALGSAISLRRYLDA